MGIVFKATGDFVRRQGGERSRLVDDRGMVFGETQEADGWRDKPHQLAQGRDVPGLRVGRHSQGREARLGHKEIPLQILRQKVQSAHIDSLRLEEDTAVREDRIPSPPVRVPFPDDERKGQQERRKDRRFLAQPDFRDP